MTFNHSERHWVPSSLHGIRVLDPHHGFAFNGCDSFERPRTCRFDSRFGYHVGEKVQYESVQLELVNLRKWWNLVTTDYDWTGYINPYWIWTNAMPKAPRWIPIHLAATKPNSRVRLFSKWNSHATIHHHTDKIHTHKNLYTQKFIRMKVPTCSYTQLIDSKIMRAMKWIIEWKPAWVHSLAGPTYKVN